MLSSLLKVLEAISDYFLSRDSRVARLKRKERVLKERILREYAKGNDRGVDRLLRELKRVRDDIATLS